MNLRDFQREQWEQFDARWFVMPRAIAGCIAKLAAPPAEDQTDHIERHVADFHGLPWLPNPDGMRSSTEAEWFIQFTFSHRFISGTAQLCRGKLQ